MADTMNLILAAPPNLLKSAASFGYPIAHMAYKIGHSPYLYRSDIAESVKNGIMAVDARELIPSPAEGQLVSEILKECEFRQFSGILLDIEQDKVSSAASFCRRLSEAAENSGLDLYITEAAAAHAKSAKVLVETAISGGTITERLKGAVSKYGAGRIALDIERVRMDFTLPSYEGKGEPLTAEQLERLLRQRHSPSFFSKDLCAHYFTYRNKDTAHFVLYDNALSIRRKMAIAGKMGIETVFLFYPEVRNILNEIRGKPL